ncbi:MAG: bifunctional diaminohydroxyphosphoribosylaminopyrimidine deaminase/5-amino-6-(5-phosphoribosylamino)uracil reductase RibD [Candidatus Symbiothrix sp.]|jgi:diaminohydroxyphosphoribosylaminopyrimidine deaminase/5-amino-6-(5-phosphoribosylamino)uracil reductase|nr:bifunctional diaminohydroxyphosphoribosylaminopyrimidine deaminase/5-amino-6-(5-phosphoribosylamino)uracil reductase RibD [Candidatus Symbiothrix sp.]
MVWEEKYMYRCLQLAAYGKGFTASNPLVGVVIVHQGKIIGEGFHRKYGEAHAEVLAIASVTNKNFLKESTLYVNLEPCVHYGKTPPCTELIIKKQIPRVVIGQVDPYPEVAGRGISRLREAGIEVICGALEADCKKLNKRFLTYIQKKRPYIILKWAQSSDGFMDYQREENDGQKPVRFSNAFTQTLVHKLRAQEASIMVGKRTALLDKPLLNVRYWNGNDPLRIIAQDRIPLKELMATLYEQKIQSLIVEGGATLLRSFLDEALWDETHIEISPLVLGKGLAAPLPKGQLQSVQKCENSLNFYYDNAAKT